MAASSIDASMRFFPSVKREGEKDIEREAHNGNGKRLIIICEPPPPAQFACLFDFARLNTDALIISEVEKKNLHLHLLISIFCTMKKCIICLLLHRPRWHLVIPALDRD